MSVSFALARNPWTIIRALLRSAPGCRNYTGLRTSSSTVHERNTPPARRSAAKRLAASPYWVDQRRPHVHLGVPASSVPTPLRPQPPSRDDHKSMLLEFRRGYL